LSNSLAIATVTAALRDVVLEALQGVSPLSGAPAVSLGRPENRPRGEFVGANIYLYRVSPNPALRNNHLPSRDASRNIVARPRIALDLYYVLTFYGQASALEAQRLMASVMTALELNPELAPERIRQTISRTDFLRGSDLDLQSERVRFTMEFMTLEELSKLWSVFFQMTHELSVAYQASVVLLDSQVPVTKPLPVSRAQTALTASPVLYIDNLEPALMDFESGAAVTVFGKGLDTPSLSIMIGDQLVQPSGQMNDRLEFALPAGVTPGVNEVVVLRRGSGNVEVARSNARPLLVRPVLQGPLTLAKVPVARVTASGIASIVQTPTVQFLVNPPIGRLQSAIAWLNPAPGAAPGLKATSSSSLMRAGIDPRCRSELDAGSAGNQLQLAFLAVGLNLNPNTRVNIRTPGSSWTIFDRHTRAHYWVSLVNGEMFVNYGLSESEPEGWTAIDLTGIAPGSYLIRLQIGPHRLAETPLQQDAKSGEYAGPKLEVPAGGS